MVCRHGRHNQDGKERIPCPAAPCRVPPGAGGGLVQGNAPSVPGVEDEVLFQLAGVRVTSATSAEKPPLEGASRVSHSST